METLFYAVDRRKKSGRAFIRPATEYDMGPVGFVPAENENYSIEVYSTEESAINRADYLNGK